MKQRFSLLAAGIFGATGVALGALGAHKLEPLLAERGMSHAWETAARYHMIHAVALLGIAAWQRARGRLSTTAAQSFIIVDLFAKALQLALQEQGQRVTSVCDKA